MPRIISLYSGSSGNCTAIESPDGLLLIDMGKSCRATLSALYSLGYSASDVRAVLVTHEHSDHIGGLMTFLKHYRVPLCGTHNCLDLLSYRNLVPETADLREIVPGRESELFGLGVTPFHTSHDSVECVGYRLDFGRQRAAVATDLGCVGAEVFESLSGCVAVALESNYDERMLVEGSYPYYLKRRIMSSEGHLSNPDCAATVARLAEGGCRDFLLMHLSSENNQPEMAFAACSGALENYGAEGCSVEVAPRHAPSRYIEIGG